MEEVHSGSLGTQDRSHWVATFHPEGGVVVNHATRQAFLAHGALAVATDKVLAIDRVLVTDREPETDKELATDREPEIDKVLEIDKVVEHGPITHWEAPGVVLDLRRKKKKIAKHF